MLWFQPCRKMPPPPWELWVMVSASMLDGLHEKLLGNGLTAPVASTHVAPFGADTVFCSKVVPVGKPASSVGSYGLEGKFTPLPSTVMPAPSSAPIKDGSCSNSARLPFRLVSQPSTASSGKRSTCGLMGVGVK